METTMHPFVIHIANGQSFFTGVILLVAGICLRSRRQTGRTARIGSLLITTGFLLAAISATPLSVLTWIVLVALAVLMLNARMASNRKLTITTGSLWIVAAAFEASWHFTPVAQDKTSLQNLPIVVLADSVTAGLGEGEANTWPSMLATQRRTDVIDLSHVGETVGSALKRANSQQLPESAVFILELGGNDILGSTSVSKFADDLDQLLGHVCSENRVVFLFELPLPPFHNRWGAIQRNACLKHGVLLIPKHRLASVFQGDTSTLDSIHLSQEGHNRMLRIIQQLLRL